MARASEVAAATIAAAVEARALASALLDALPSPLVGALPALAVALALATLGKAFTAVVEEEEDDDEEADEEDVDGSIFVKNKLNEKSHNPQLTRPHEVGQCAKVVDYGNK